MSDTASMFPKEGYWVAKPEESITDSLLQIVVVGYPFHGKTPQVARIGERARYSIDRFELLKFLCPLDGPAELLDKDGEK